MKVNLQHVRQLTAIDFPYVTYVTYVIYVTYVTISYINDQNFKKAYLKFAKNLHEKFQNCPTTN